MPSPLIQVILCHQLTEDGRRVYQELTGSSKAEDKKSGGDLLLDNRKLKEFVGKVEEMYGDESKSDFDVLNSLGRARNRFYFRLFLIFGFFSNIR